MHLSFKSYRKKRGVTNQIYNKTIILFLGFTYIVNFTNVPHFSVWLQIPIRCFFISSFLKDSLYHFFRAGLLVINYLSFCLSENVLFFPSFLKVSFARYRILGGQISFSMLKTSFHCPLDSMVSD